MIRDDRIKDAEGLALFKEALRDLIMRVPLAGLSYLGESVEVFEDESCMTLCTDGRKVWYAPSWMKKKDLKARIFDILHEWIHIFMNHVARRGDRDGNLWNIACDVVVIRECLSLLGRGFEVPEDGVQIPPWAGDMSAEEIYEVLKKDPSKQKDVSGDGGLEGDFRYESAASYTQAEEDHFFLKFQEELAQADAVIRSAEGQPLPDFIRSRMDEILRDQLPWSTLLRGDLLAELGGDQPTYSPPNRRFYGWSTPWGKPLILPSYRSVKEKRLLLGIDVSASVGKTLMDRFIANVTPAAARANEIVIITFDQVIRERVVARYPRQILGRVQFYSGAHYTTDVRPVFEVVDEVQPSAVCILTDGYLHYPDNPYPQTLWVVPQNGGDPPWGRRYQMEVSW